RQGGARAGRRGGRRGAGGGGDRAAAGVPGPRRGGRAGGGAVVPGDRPGEGEADGGQPRGDGGGGAGAGRRGRAGGGGAWAAAGSARARYLCKRLRSRHEQLPIIAAVWGAGADEQLASQLRAAGATRVVTTLAEARAQVVPLLQVARHVEAG